MEEERWPRLSLTVCVAVPWGLVLLVLFNEVTKLTEAFVELFANACATRLGDTWLWLDCCAGGLVAEASRDMGICKVKRVPLPSPALKGRRSGLKGCVLAGCT